MIFSRRCTCRAVDGIARCGNPQCASLTDPGLQCPANKFDKHDLVGYFVAPENQECLNCMVYSDPHFIRSLPSRTFCNNVVSVEMGLAAKVSVDAKETDGKGQDSQGRDCKGRDGQGIGGKEQGSQVIYGKGRDSQGKGKYCQNAKGKPPGAAYECAEGGKCYKGSPFGAKGKGNDCKEGHNCDWAKGEGKARNVEIALQDLTARVADLDNCVQHMAAEILEQDRRLTANEQDRDIEIHDREALERRVDRIDDECETHGEHIGGLLQLHPECDTARWLLPNFGHGA